MAKDQKSSTMSTRVEWKGDGDLRHFHSDNTLFRYDLREFDEGDRYLLTVSEQSGAIIAEYSVRDTETASIMVDLIETDRLIFAR